MTDHSSNSTHPSNVIEILSSDEESTDEKDVIHVVEKKWNEKKVSCSASSLLPASTPTDGINNSYLAKVSLLHQPSELWKGTMQRCQELNVKFVDDTFPPNSSSIDGRKIHSTHETSAQHLNNVNEKESIKHLKGTTASVIGDNSTSTSSNNSSTKMSSSGKMQSNQRESDSKLTNVKSTTIIKCRCGVPASIKTVQKDGPNYGRFFLSCGRKKPARIKKKKRKKRKRVNNNNNKSNENDQTSKKEGNGDVIILDGDCNGDDDGEGDDEIIVIDDDKDIAVTAKKFQNHNSAIDNDMRPQCSFFQWDDNHRQEVTYSSSSRTAWMHTLSWFRYETKHGYSLTYPKGFFSPDHVKQGGMGDCWFLSALAVVAEKSYLIQQLLPHFEFNDVGCYEVRFCLSGNFSSVLVDSLLPSVPCQKEIKNKQSITASEDRESNKLNIDVRAENSNKSLLSFQPVFASGRVSWPAIIEKAYAKVHGSYSRLSGGYISEALYDLTGAPIERIYFHTEYDYDQLFARLLSFMSSGFLMGIATSKGGDGLVSCHAYSLLGVYEIYDSIEGSQGKMTQYTGCNIEKENIFNSCNDMERKTVRLVCIRNPWGKREWKGKWSSTSEQWTRKIRQQLSKEFCKQGNGTFFMSFEDMIRRFDHLDVAKCQEVRKLICSYELKLCLLYSIILRPSFVSKFPHFCKGWLRASLGGVVKLNGTGDALSSSPLVYYCQAETRTWSYMSLVQKKKRANTTTQFWYTDMSMVVLKRRHNVNSWTRCQCVMQGVKRSCDVELFLDPEFEYCIIPFSYLGGIEELQCGAQVQRRKSALFRLTSYSAHTVELKARPRKSIDNNKLLIESLHLSLLETNRKLIYSLGPGAVLVAVCKSGCIYFLVINSASDGLMTKLMVETSPDRMIVHGLNNDTHITPSKSQSIVLVLANKGHDRTTTVNFNFQSDICIDKTPFERKFAYRGIETSVGLSLASELVCNNIGSETNTYRRASGTLDECLWNN